MKSKQIQEFKETNIGKIPIDWQVVKFSDISEFHYGKMPQKNDIIEKGYPIFSGYRIVGHHKKFMYEDEKLIIVARGVGGTGDIKLSPPKSYITNLAIIANLNEDLVDKRFLHYYFFKGLRYLDSGSAQSQITINDLNNVKIALPPITEQLRIAKIFSDMDFKIKLLQNQNTILEKIIQSIFKSWFVDFDGKTEFVDSDLGKIPKGWEVGNIGIVCDEVTDGSHISPKEFPDGTKRIASVKNMRSYDFDITSCKRISNDDYEKLVRSGCKPDEGDILFSKDGTMGITHLFNGEKNLVLLSSIAIIKTLKNFSNNYLLTYLKQKDSQLILKEGYSSGSALPRIILKDLKKFRILVPTTSILQKFDLIFNELHEKIIDNVKLIDLNVNTKNLLMPKLFTGEIKV